MNPTQKTIWDNILNFDLDQPTSEYGFSTRLAYENGWSIFFTQQAIEEYKKFFFMATISNEMVSPSPIVDVVWHQHLIFTQSYQRLCELGGKQIAHVPSTHNYAEKGKFDRAWQHTLELYREFWGNPPAEIWLEPTFMSVLDSPALTSNMQGANTNRMLFGVMLIAFYPLMTWLRPVIVSIENPYFLTSYWFTFVGIFCILIAYKIMRLALLGNLLFAKGIFHRLSPFELIYMKRNKIADVVHGVMNQLLKTQKIRIESDNKISSLVNTKKAESGYELAVLQSLEVHNGQAYYPAILTNVLKKEIFTQTEQFVKHLGAKISRLKAFANLQVFTFTVWLLFFSFGLMRLITGMERDKPVLFLFISLAVMLALTLLFSRITVRYLLQSYVPQKYQERYAPKLYVDGSPEYWQWQYFALGAAMLESSFTPIVTHVERTKETENGGSSSCGSSCSSGGDGGGGCGGGCGGCGGGD
jgi:uncharacterized protein (TIGR04222 family)